MKTKEIWKDIPDYEGIYQASNLGRIRSLERDVPNGKKSFKHLYIKVLKTQLKPRKKKCKTKDEIISLHKNKKQKTYYVSHLVAKTFLGESNLTINHINGNTLDNRIENLEWCSLQENIKKGYEQGLYNKTFSGIKVLDKLTGTVYVFESCASAGRFFGKSQSCWTKPKKETKRFKWEIL